MVFVEDPDEKSPLIASSINRSRRCCCFIIAGSIFVVALIALTIGLAIRTNHHHHHHDDDRTAAIPLNIIGNFTTRVPYVAAAVAETYCPYHDMNGISHYCNATLRSTNSPKLPVILGVGWDPVTGQIKLPFLKSSYRSPRYYTSNSGMQYQIPDQVDLTIKNLSQPIMSTNVYTNIDQYLANMYPNRTTINGGTLSMPLNLMPEFIHFFSTGTTNVVSVTEVRHNYQLAFNTNDTVVIPSIQSAIDSLPLEYDPDTYGLFIDYWGTQIVVAGTAGGLGQQTVMAKNCFGGIDLSSQSELYILKQFYAEKYSHVNFAAGFEQYSRASIIDMYGGDPEFFEPGNWTQRVQTMDDEPVLVEVVTRPITDFIVNTTIRTNIQRAIDDYYMTGINATNKYRQDYFNGVHGPKTVEFVAVSDPASSVLVTYQTSMVANQMFKEPIANELCQIGICPFFYCTRTDTGVRAELDMNAMNIYNNDFWNKQPETRGRYGVFAETAMGPVVSYGSSMASYRVVNPPLMNHQNTVLYVGYCCMDCIPSAVNNGGKMYFQGCSCPAF